MQQQPLPTRPARAHVLRGARRAIPIALGVFAYGVVFGALTGQAHLRLSEALLMSGLVFAGSAQFVALGLWAHPLPIGGLILAALIVNLRYLLLGAALMPLLRGLRPPLPYAALFLLNDEGWALTMAEHRARGPDASPAETGLFFLGSGLLIYPAWVAATLVGHLAGGLLGDPRRLGLDFAFTAVFVALLAGLWRGRADLLPWLVAAAVAVATERWLGGTWYILLGGVAGSAVGAARHA